MTNHARLRVETRSVAHSAERQPYRPLRAPPTSTSDPRRGLSRHGARSLRPLALSRSGRRAPLPRAAGQGDRSTRLGMRLLLLDADALSPRDSHTRSRSCSWDPTPQRLLRPGVQSPTRPRGARLLPPLLLGPDRTRSAPSRARPVRPEEPGAGGPLRQAGRLAVEQLPGSFGPVPAASVSGARMVARALRTGSKERAAPTPRLRRGHALAPGAVDGS